MRAKAVSRKLAQTEYEADGGQKQLSQGRNLVLAPDRRSVFSALRHFSHHESEHKSPHLPCGDVVVRIAGRRLRVRSASTSCVLKFRRLQINRCQRA